MSTLAGERGRVRPARSADGASSADRAGRVRPADPVRLADRPLLSYHLVVAVTVLLSAFGLVMVLSASSVQSYQVSGSSFTTVEHQLQWVVLGTPLFVLAAHAPLAWVRRSAYPLLATGLLGLVAVLVPGVGSGAYGATRWISLGSFTLQPSEVTKLALAVWGADLLARKSHRLADWHHLFIPLLPVGAAAAALVLLEPDMGTAIVLVLVVLALLWLAGAPAAVFGAVAAGVAVLAGLVAVVSPYRLARLTSFVHPFAHAQGSGYQAVQGIYALASGGWWGLGLGASREKWDYLPNAHTDFVFAVVGEELGLVGTLLVLALFAVLAYVGIRIALRNTEVFVRLCAGAITVWLAAQALINIGAVVGLLPITGIPLPLVSFGGSALVPTLAGLGLLAGFARREPPAAALLAARRRDRERRRQEARARQGRPPAG